MQDIGVKTGVDAAINRASVEENSIDEAIEQEVIKEENEKEKREDKRGKSKSARQPKIKLDNPRPTAKEAAVQAAGEDVADAAGVVLTDEEGAAQAITSASGKHGKKANKKTAARIVDDAIDEGLDKVEVGVAAPGKPELVRNASGQGALVVLAEDEDYREVVIGGEITLVLNSSLSQDEAASLTTAYIASKLETIAERHGVSRIFEPLFLTIAELGMPHLVEFYLSYHIPKLNGSVLSRIFTSNDVADFKDEALRWKSEKVPRVKTH